MAIARISTRSRKEEEMTKKRSPLPSPSKPKASADESTNSPPPKRNKAPGVRVVGGRIYDSEHGKTCHQCRQKTRDLTASCKNVSQGKPCTIMFCHKCLLNRYGEKVAEVAALVDWKCPKCKGICNCSFCMKKRGQRPTGILVHAAKATGFSSVSALLNQEGPKGSDLEMIAKDINVSPNKSPISSKKLLSLKRKRDMEKSVAQKIITDPDIKASTSDDEKKVKLGGNTKEKRTAKIQKLGNSGENTHACKRGNVDNKSNFQDKLPSVKEEEEEKDIMPFERISKEIVVKSKKKEDKSDKMKGSLPGDNETKGLAHEDFKGNISKDVLENSREKKEMNGMKEVLLDGDDIRVSGGAGGGDVAKPFFKVSRPRKRIVSSVYKFVDPETLLPQKTLLPQGTLLPQNTLLPEGTLLKTVAGIELQEEDVGPMLQFLEFCAAFGKVLHINKGEPEAVLRELAYMGTKRRRLFSLNVQLHIKLLSAILKDTGDKPVPVFTNGGSKWLQALGKCIAKSQCGLSELPSDFSITGSVDYENLDFSRKLRVLNFLCDEFLGTEELRNWINEENTKFVEGKKEAKEKGVAAKEKIKHLKQKLKADLVKAMLSSRDSAPLTIVENDNLISKLKLDTEIAHADMLHTLNLVPQTKQRCDAVRTEPTFFVGNGQVYWRLRSYCDSSNIILQEIGNWDSVAPKDKWFVYEAEQEKVLEKHISSLRSQKLGRSKLKRSHLSENCEQRSEHDSVLV